MSDVGAATVPPQVRMEVKLTIRADTPLGPEVVVELPAGWVDADLPDGDTEQWVRNVALDWRQMVVDGLNAPEMVESITHHLGMARFLADMARALVRHADDQE